MVLNTGILLAALPLPGPATTTGVLLAALAGAAFLGLALAVLARSGRSPEKGTSHNPALWGTTAGVALTVLAVLVANSGGDPAIPRAYTNKLIEGLPQEARDTISFTAPDSGSFRIFCGVPGHGLSGMWIRFTVDPAAKEPRFETKPAKG